MKTLVTTFFCCLALGTGYEARCTTLPDACGDAKTQLDVKTEKSAPLPAPPQAGKAQLVFIGLVDGSAAGGCIGCNAISTTRIGLDGSWVGAVKGGSYFTVDIAPGEHHLCAYWKSFAASRGKNISVAPFSAEAGKVYYEQVLIKDVEAGVSGRTPGPIWVLDMSALNEDEGKYKQKISSLAVSTSK
jgi:hypothetical protein